jgi:restriction endonuclease
MKLHFEPNLDYQVAAVESVCDLFRGQETCRTEFTVTQGFGSGQAALAGPENDLGIGNRLSLLDDELLANLNQVQLRNGLKPSDSLASGDFTVEMETGTGKTYVQEVGTQRLYLVVETKSGLFADDLCDRESAKIKCGEEHFKAIAVGENAARFVKATNLDDVLSAQLPD